MARFQFFSCCRSSKVHIPYSKRDGYAGRAESPQRFEADEAEFQNSVANVRVFESRELIVATDNFNPGRFLGEGRLGRVYKGILEDGQEVAVKRFYEQPDLWAEVRMLSCLVKMIGYCDKRKYHIIVCEFMPLRSLNLHLQDLKLGKKPLDWKTRMKIAQGVAKALEYLHDPPIIYSGLKSTGILLDENYNPKLSDFCCAKHGPIWVYTTNDKSLSYGYIPPEYALCGKLTLKSDIYSFGVVLLKLISWRKALDETKFYTAEKWHIVAWARPLLGDSKKFPEIVDPLMKGQYPYRGLGQALNLVKMCLQQEEAHKRPRIAEVVTCDYSFKYNLPNLRSTGYPWCWLPLFFNTSLLEELASKGSLS
ncbi:receptor-like cytoplasmic kinase 185 [Papaver somniferum]|uniref:receptor-like cytoplasmic kinase 185 n=1 Tax=Papaver somniferum TaxID=3469 RepID=UPI000E6FABEB|nr:receptor-like cytoplasmic kinase 185 [Papaver somniferum]